MGLEISYVLITPYALLKSRTGGIVARLLSRSDLELIGAQILALTPAFADSFASAVEKDAAGQSEGLGELLGTYIRTRFVPDSEGKKERSLLLLFQGENVCEKLNRMIGGFCPSTGRVAHSAETIRDTFAELILEDACGGKVCYFEPAVLTPSSADHAVEQLKLLGEFAAKQPNIIDHTTASEPGEERSLVMIKPDNWQYPSVRPGCILDILSGTGLRIVGCKVNRMSVADALEFYGPVQEALRSKLAPKIGKKAKLSLEQQYGVAMEESATQALTRSVGFAFADQQFSDIIEFMSGKRPETCSTDAERTAPGTAQCLVLIYEGTNAIQKIRTALGPTDPSKAPGGTVRRDFGKNIMVNTAHASDSPESVTREMGVVRITRNELASKIAQHLTQTPQPSN